MTPPINLSAVIITKNEEHCIGRCLDSVSFADEIVILDSESTDRTGEIARSRGAQVFSSSDWPGFGPQKNRALGLAKGRWILSIDADEVVTPELSSAITEVVVSQQQDDRTQSLCYWVMRRSLYCGKVIRYGDWHNDRVVRLFRREYARFTNDLVHERVECHGPHGALSGYLWHESAVTRAEFKEKVTYYAELGAVRLRARAKGGRLSASVHGIWSFFRGYILRAGFLDGSRGLEIAWQNARGTFLRYLWAAQTGPRPQ